MRIAILTTASAPGLDALATDPRRGTLYDIAAVIDSGKRPRNLTAREVQDAATAAALRKAKPDWILLAGYRYIVTRPVLDAFPNRIIALHDGDLTLKDDDGSRRYKGLHAVRDALFSGERETRSSAYIVTEKVGEGPLFLLSGAYRAAQLAENALRWGAADLLSAYANLHREWMIRDAFGPMLVRIAELLAAGDIRIVRDVAWVDGVPGPCRMGEAPVGCREVPLHGIPKACPFISST